MKDKLCVISLKYIPVICAFLMMLHIVFLNCGIILCVAELTVLTLTTLMVIIWSCVLKFCVIHKITTIYTLGVLWCCYIQRTIGFGRHLEITRTVMLILGVMLFLILGAKYVEDNKESVTKDNK